MTYMNKVLILCQDGHVRTCCVPLQSQLHITLSFAVCKEFTQQILETHCTYLFCYHERKGGSLSHWVSPILCNVCKTYSTADLEQLCCISLSCLILQPLFETLTADQSQVIQKSIEISYFDVLIDPLIALFYSPNFFRCAMNSNISFVFF